MDPTFIYPCSPPTIHDPQMTGVLSYKKTWMAVPVAAVMMAGCRFVSLAALVVSGDNWICSQPYSKRLCVASW